MISEFASYFEIFSLLNLGYAGSKEIRLFVNDDVLRIKEEYRRIENDFDLLTSEFYVVAGIESVNYEEEQEHIKREKRLFERKRTIINNHYSKLSESLPKSLRAIYFFATIYCFSIILVSGYEQFYEPVSINEFICFLNLTGLYMVFLFARSFTKKGKRRNFNSILVVLLFALLILFFFVSLTPNFPTFIKSQLICSPKMCLLFSILVAITPFLLNALRIYIHRFMNRYCLYLLVDQTRYTIVTINNTNTLRQKPIAEILKQRNKERFKLIDLKGKERYLFCFIKAFRIDQPKKREF